MGGSGVRLAASQVIERPLRPRCSGSWPPNTSRTTPKWDLAVTLHHRDVTQTASEVSRLVHEARDLNLPIEPGVRDGRDALVRWAALLNEVIP
jgi:hypothetical protein